MATHGAKMMTEDASTSSKERLIHVDEVARRYGIHPKTALRFAKEKKIPAPLEKKFGKRPCWRESVIDQHLESLK